LIHSRGVEEENLYGKNIHLIQQETYMDESIWK